MEYDKFEPFLATCRLEGISDTLAVICWTNGFRTTPEIRPLKNFATGSKFDVLKAALEQHGPPDYKKTRWSAQELRFLVDHVDTEDDMRELDNVFDTRVIIECLEAHVHPRVIASCWENGLRTTSEIIPLQGITAGPKFDVLKAALEQHGPSDYEKTRWTGQELEFLVRNIHTQNDMRGLDNVFNKRAIIECIMCDIHPRAIAYFWEKGFRTTSEIILCKDLTENQFKVIKVAKEQRLADWTVDELRFLADHVDTEEDMRKLNALIYTDFPFECVDTDLIIECLDAHVHPRVIAACWENGLRTIPEVKLLQGITAGPKFDVLKAALEQHGPPGFERTHWRGQELRFLVDHVDTEEDMRKLDNVFDTDLIIECLEAHVQPRVIEAYWQHNVRTADEIKILADIEDIDVVCECLDAHVYPRVIALCWQHNIRAADEIRALANINDKDLIRECLEAHVHHRVIAVCWRNNIKTANEIKILAAIKDIDLVCNCLGARIDPRVILFCWQHNIRTAKDIIELKYIKESDYASVEAALKNNFTCEQIKILIENTDSPDEIESLIAIANTEADKNFIIDCLKEGAPANLIKLCWDKQIKDVDDVVDLSELDFHFVERCLKDDIKNVDYIEAMASGDIKDFEGYNLNKDDFKNYIISCINCHIPPKHAILMLQAKDKNEGIGLFFAACKPNIITGLNKLPKKAREAIENFDATHVKQSSVSSQPKQKAPRNIGEKYVGEYAENLFVQQVGNAPKFSKKSACKLYKKLNDWFANMQVSLIALFSEEYGGFMFFCRVMRELVTTVLMYDDKASVDQILNIIVKNIGSGIGVTGMLRNIEEFIEERRQTRASSSSSASASSSSSSSSAAAAEEEEEGASSASAAVPQQTTTTSSSSSSSSSAAAAHRRGRLFPASAAAVAPQQTTTTSSSSSSSSSSSLSSAADDDQQEVRVPASDIENILPQDDTKLSLYDADDVENCQRLLTQWHSIADVFGSLPSGDIYDEKVEAYMNAHYREIAIMAAEYKRKRFSNTKIEDLLRKLRNAIEVNHKDISVVSLYYLIEAFKFKDYDATKDFVVALEKSGMKKEIKQKLAKALRTLTTATQRDDNIVISKIFEALRKVNRKLRRIERSIPQTEDIPLTEKLIEANDEEIMDALEQILETIQLQ